MQGVKATVRGHFNARQLTGLAWTDLQVSFWYYGRDESEDNEFKASG
jgi:hypothetical protein